MPKKKELGLTKRQMDVVKLLVNGYSNEETAEKLGLSRSTVEAHRARIILKLNIHTLAGLVKYAIKENITTVDIHRDYASN